MRGWLAASGRAVAWAAVCFLWVNGSYAAIDAVRGRQYQITKRHGPWMIMVATFHDPLGGPADHGKGLSPKQAADELVYELRKNGIPAYAFQQKDSYGSVRTLDRTGRARRSLTAYHGGVAVLAGNYRSPSDTLAQATLKYVKRFTPKFLSDVEGRKKLADGTEFFRLRSGGLFRATPGRPTPFAGAHLTPNPLLSPEELHAHRKDPLLLKLNSGNDFSLLNNKGKYTLIVASFYGKSLTVPKGDYQRKADDFKVTNALDLAGRNAWELAVALRKYKKMEAWVYHDRYKSVVTIGSFASPQGKAIDEYTKMFMAKYRIHPQFGNKVLTAEMLTIPLELKPNERPQRRWVFDPKPETMMVPHISD